jgi:tetratricopeptide (TPR) repeat protein
MVKRIHFLFRLLVGLAVLQVATECYANAATDLEQAEQYREDGNHEQAETIYKAIVAADANTDEAFTAQQRLVFLYAERGNQIKEGDAFEKLVTDFSEKESLPSFLLGQLGNRYRELDRCQKARQVYQYVIDKWPNDNHAMYAQTGLVNAYLQEGDYTGAVSAVDVLFNRYVSNENLPEVALAMGNEFRSKRKWKKARELFQYYVAKSPQDARAMRAQRMVAKAGVLLGDDAATDTEIGKLLSIFGMMPDITTEIMELADDCEKHDKFEKALVLYQHVINHWPQDEHAIWARRGIAKAYVQLGDDDKVQETLSQLLATFGDHNDIAKAVDNVADEYHKVGKYEKARQWHQYVVDHWPQNEHALEAQKGVVISNIALGDQTTAQAVVDKLISDFKINAEEIAEAIDDVASTCCTMKDYTKAKQLYQLIVTNWPTAEYAVEAQGDVVRCSILLGDEAGAQAAIDKLLVDYGWHENAAKEVERLAELYQDRKDYTKAKQLYQHIVTNWPTTGRAVNAQGRVADCCIRLGDETGAQAAYDGMLAAFGNHPRLSESMYFFAEEYIKSGMELENSTDLVGAQQYFRKGLDILEKTLNDFPTTPYAPEMYHWAGDTYFRLADYADSGDTDSRLADYTNSLKCFQKITKDYPRYKYAWHAQFTVGRNYEGMMSLGHLSEAEAKPLISAAYEKLIEKYPTCQSVAYAQNWLDKNAAK